MIGAELVVGFALRGAVFFCDADDKSILRCNAGNALHAYYSDQRTGLPSKCITDAFEIYASKEGLFPNLFEIVRDSDGNELRRIRLIAEFACIKERITTRGDK